MSVLTSRRPRPGRRGATGQLPASAAPQGQPEPGEQVGSELDVPEGLLSELAVLAGATMDTRPAELLTATRALPALALEVAGLGMEGTLSGIGVQSVDGAQPDQLSVSAQLLDAVGEHRAAMVGLAALLGADVIMDGSLDGALATTGAIKAGLVAAGLPAAAATVAMSVIGVAAATLIAVNEVNKADRARIRDVRLTINAYRDETMCQVALPGARPARSRPGAPGHSWPGAPPAGRRPHRPDLGQQATRRCSRAAGPPGAGGPRQPVARCRVMTASLAREHLLDRWEQRYEGRTDWAENAVAQHLEGFDPEVRDRLATRDREATIALYGPTQVGKTTLILKMLGVSDAAALTVGEVLRGGRPAGESATATAMRYRVSDDAGWAWVDGADLLSDASQSEIVDRLRALRISVEAGSRDPGAAPVEVGIPRALLDADAAPLPIRIIDLPGIQSDNAGEQAHVQDLAGTYLPHADVIVILGKADSLEFLKPEVLALPGLLDWWVAPHRFRIVLTHAHLLGTAMEFARTHPAEHVPLHDLRTHYLEQVRTHDFPADIAWDQVPDILFPLEYGQSWADPGGGHLRRRVERANSTAFTDLRNSLTALSSAEARLAQTYHAYRVAAAVPQRRYQQEQAALRDVEERARRITEQIASRRDEADLLRQRRDKDRHTLCTANRRVATPPGPADGLRVAPSAARRPGRRRAPQPPPLPVRRRHATHQGLRRAAGRLDGVGRAADRQRDPGSPRGRSGQERGPRDHPHHPATTRAMPSGGPGGARLSCGSNFRRMVATRGGPRMRPFACSRTGPATPNTRT